MFYKLSLKYSLQIEQNISKLQKMIWSRENITKSIKKNSFT